jgi:hypothetical protein
VGFSVVAKRLSLAAALLLSVLFVASAAPSQARASTDVMFVFDTTGSMGGAISEAQSEINEAMTQISSSIPDVQFGLASMADYGYDTLNYNGLPEEFFYDEEIPADVPWVLHQAITPNQALVSSELLKLTADGGGDSPEAYGRALYESDVNPAVAWRPGARGVIVLIADDVPHDNELNEGIPAEFWDESPFNTGVDPGRDNTLGTSDDLDWQAVLKQLTFDGRPLEFVDYHGYSGYLPYWKQWAGSTGGSALSAELGPLGPQIVAAVKAGASAALPACPTGLIRDPGSHCVSPPPPPPAPSNSFKIEPRISCAKGCYVVEVKIVFDSAGHVIAESVIGEEPAHSSSAGISAAKKGKATKKGKKKKPKLIKTLSQNVNPGANTLKLKLTGAAKATLRKKGSVKLKVKFSYTPTGGTVKTAVHTFNVKAPVKPKKKHSAPK